MFNAKKRKIEELQAMVDVYGEALRGHHDSMGSCDEVAGSLRATRDALKARVDELERKLIAVGHVAFRVTDAEARAES